MHFFYEKGCDCSNFVTKKGYGNCKKIGPKKLAYKPYCYVVQPSSCDDLHNSTAYPGKQFSANACNGKGNKNHLTNP